MEPESSDQPFITQSPTKIFLEGNFTKVPMIIGTVNAEGINFFTGMYHSIFSIIFY